MFKLNKLIEAVKMSERSRTPQRVYNEHELADGDESQFGNQLVQTEKKLQFLLNI